MAGMGHPLYTSIIGVWSPPQTALSGLTDLASATITVTFAGGASAACEDSTTVSTGISIDLDYGNYPLKVILLRVRESYPPPSRAQTHLLWLLARRASFGEVVG